LCLVGLMLENFISVDSDIRDIIIDLEKKFDSELLRGRIKNYYILNYKQSYCSDVSEVTLYLN